MNKKWNEPFHDNGTLHKGTVIPFDHRIIMNLYNSKFPLNIMGSDGIFLKYPDGKETLMDEVHWVLHGKQILKNCTLQKIKARPIMVVAGKKTRKNRKQRRKK